MKYVQYGNRSVELHANEFLEFKYQMELLAKKKKMAHKETNQVNPRKSLRFLLKTFDTISIPSARLYDFIGFVSLLLCCGPQFLFFMAKDPLTMYV